MGTLIKRIVHMNFDVYVRKHINQGSLGGFTSLFSIIIIIGWCLNYRYIQKSTSKAESPRNTYSEFFRMSTANNRNHMLICPATITLVQKLWSLIDPAPPPEVHLIDYALNCLPQSFKSPGTWCDWWPCLLALLRAVDQTTSSYKLPEEKAHGQILIDLAAKFRATKPTHPHRIPPPTQEPVPGDPFPHLLSEISTVPHQPPPSVPARNCA
ncbi:hypothetical protein PHYBLDRAFT_174848 [Phycomyces blakesleeanus NRRL 1555(-)]|uniref:Uncharacterized protein n=1 Tax=Phycomyces blakesleeanus (strain ATCC 8743b / DSM 1359 / FGSC 10004 / NBRC 33097 / NRRL 1555) TaxID=763407 RepID=A0A162N8I1_PHYB8|nr:hypothetical protein PHYBLDRAFT_174848 [Phycomyces blakesleeanus NRRL 1555(-)]OAD66824.1 hypothetical protein PHYBLDRAFT_174848 [Phycomyces blakesleeanus NRRL 1555(-)]|eukprot:XP_018284864.1 hypothetical protein PHYBLDRAFT_174848 [Phycomyces blakesleeanus NRRL 1555(-)]